MTRTSGTFLLLAAVSGCISFNPDPVGEAKDSASTTRPVPTPAVATWMESGHLPTSYQYPGGTTRPGLAAQASAAPGPYAGVSRNPLGPARPAPLPVTAETTTAAW